jgi:hypothetical protein
MAGVDGIAPWPSAVSMDAGVRQALATVARSPQRIQRSLLR